MAITKAKVFTTSHLLAMGLFWLHYSCLWFRRALSVHFGANKEMRSRKKKRVVDPCFYCCCTKSECGASPVSKQGIFLTGVAEADAESKQNISWHVSVKTFGKPFSCLVYDTTVAPFYDTDTKGVYCCFHLVVKSQFLLNKLFSKNWDLTQEHQVQGDTF